MIGHNRMSGAANTDPDKVGGEDWDAPHVYDAGAIFPIGVLSFTALTDLSVQLNTVAGRIDPAVSRDATGWYVAQIDLSGLPIRNGLDVNYLVHLSAMPRGALATGWRFDAQVYPGDGLLIVACYNTLDENRDPAVKVDYSLTVYACPFVNV